MVTSKTYGFETYGDIDVLKEREEEVRLTGKKDILIKIERASVNPIDINLRKGLMSNGKPLEKFRVLGNEVQGEVIETLSTNSSFLVGEKVIALIPSGGNAEFIAVAEKNVFKIPEKMPLDIAATFPMVAEAALWTLNSYFYELKQGDTLAIVGASGSVGSIVLQLAREKKVKIIAVGSKKNNQYLKDLGADIVIDYRNETEIQAFKNTSDYVINASLFNQGEEVAVTLVKETGTILSLNQIADISKKPNVKAKLMKRTKAMTNQAAIPQLMAFYEKNGIQLKLAYRLPLTLKGVKEAHRLFESSKATGKILLVRELN